MIESERVTRFLKTGSSLSASRVSPLALTHALSHMRTLRRTRRHHTDREREREREKSEKERKEKEERERVE